VRRARAAVGRRNPGEPDDPGRRTFRSLKLLGRHCAPAWPRPAGHPKRGAFSASPSGLVGPVIGLLGPPASYFCLSIPELRI
jgi:hypothetical protein